MGKIGISVVSVAMLALVGCGAETSPMMSPLMVGSAELKQSTPYKRLMALNDLDRVAQLAIANTIVQKCPLVAANPEMGPVMRPVINRVALLQGRQKAQAAQAAQRRALDTKYGLSLDQSSDLCPVARREIAEQGPLAAFLIDKGL